MFLGTMQQCKIQEEGTCSDVTHADNSSDIKVHSDLNKPQLRIHQHDYFLVETMLTYEVCFLQLSYFVRSQFKKLRLDENGDGGELQETVVQYQGTG